jgi:adenine phosphoribosyltransferase
LEPKKFDQKLSDEDLKAKLRVIPNFPHSGVNFVDITPLLSDPVAFRFAIDRMEESVSRAGNIDTIVGIEARGFILGPPIAYKLGVGFVPARKKGKLPHVKISAEYSLEYSTEFLEMHSDAIKPGQRIAIVDDLLATGGTAEAAVKLVEKMGGKVTCVRFLIELDFLKGIEKLRGYDTFSLIHFRDKSDGIESEITSQPETSK